jgi:hypothetical protein
VLVEKRWCTSASANLPVLLRITQHVTMPPVAAQHASVALGKCVSMHFENDSQKEATLTLLTAGTKQNVS